MARLAMHAISLCTMALISGCARQPSLSEPEVPATLRAPQNQTLVLEALATGVQIYECSQKADSAYEWTFKAPEATLASRTGQNIGKHYAGPTWESPDGSAVVGELKARDPGPDVSAIPWLLLSGKTSTGSGTFATIKSIQRLDTKGGVAPGQPCTDNNLKQIVRVPYTATYYFYR